MEDPLSQPILIVSRWVFRTYFDNKPNATTWQLQNINPNVSFDQYTLPMCSFPPLLFNCSNSKLVENMKTWDTVKKQHVSPIPTKVLSGHISPYCKFPDWVLTYLGWSQNNVPHIAWFVMCLPIQIWYIYKYVFKIHQISISSSQLTSCLEGIYMHEQPEVSLPFKLVAALTSNKISICIFELAQNYNQKKLEHAQTTTVSKMHLKGTTFHSFRRPTATNGNRNCEKEGRCQQHVTARPRTQYWNAS